MTAPPAGRWGRHLHGEQDAWIRSAATDIALHGLHDLGTRRIRIGAQQGYTGEDHSGGAVAALHGFGVEKSLLQRMQAAIFSPAPQWL